MLVVLIISSDLSIPVQRKILVKKGKERNYFSSLHERRDRKLQQDYTKTTGDRNGQSNDNPEIPQDGDIQRLTLPFGKSKMANHGHNAWSSLHHKTGNVTAVAGKS